MLRYIHLLTLAQDRLFHLYQNVPVPLIWDIDMRKRYVLSQALRAGALSI